MFPTVVSENSTAAMLLLAGAAVSAFYYKFFYPVRHLRTAEQRRRVLPPGASRAHLPQGPIPVSDEEIRSTSGFYRLKSSTINGERDKQLFYTSLTPADGKIDFVAVFVHGYSNHHRSLQMNQMRVYCAKYHAHVLAFDMPSHGLSDGLFVLIQDWHEFVGAAEEIIESLGVAQCTALARDPSSPLPLFLAGVSMGGGVCATLALRRPDLYSGMILEAPMLYVSDDLKPPWVILQIFRHVIIKIPGLSSWPVAPSKDIQARCFTDPEALEAEQSSPLNYSSKPRLASAHSLAMQGPEWMESRLKEVKTPFLLVHGDADVVTDPAVSQKLYDVACSTDKALEMVKGAKHADCFWRKETYDLVERWIKKRV